MQTGGHVEKARTVVPVILLPDSQRVAQYRQASLSPYRAGKVTSPVDKTAGRQATLRTLLNVRNGGNT